MEVVDLLAAVKEALPGSGYSSSTLRVADAAIELLLEEGQAIVKKNGGTVPKKKAPEVTSSALVASTPTSTAPNLDTRVAIIGCPLATAVPKGSAHKLITTSGLACRFLHSPGRRECE